MMVCIPAIQINITREQIILLLKAKSLVDWYCQIYQSHESTESCLKDTVRYC